MPDSPPKSFSWSQEPPERLAHSAAKHDLIRDYLRRYLDIVTNVPFRRELRLTLFDGFAGGGVFIDGGNLVSGTPLILIEEVLAAHARRSDRSMAFDITLWIAEKNLENFQCLEHQIRSRSLEAIFPGKIHLRNSTFEGPLLEALQGLKSVKGGSGRSIFIFDQTGYSQVDFEHIRTIFHLCKRPEVILTFAVSWLADLARNDPDFLKRVASIGIRQEELTELLQAKEEWSPRYGAQKWLRAYIQKYIGAPHDTSFFLKSQESHKDLWLLHFAKQPRARDAMLETHYTLANEAHFYGKEGFDMLGFDPRVDHDQYRLFGFTPHDASRSIDAMLGDIPRSLRDRGGASGIPAAALFGRELNDATVTFDMFAKGMCAARDEGEVEIYTREGRLRPKARELHRDDLVKLPSQTTIWQILK